MNRHLLLPLITLLFCSACSYLPEPGPDQPEVVIRETRDYIEILPANFAGSNTGFIFYPGGLVDPHAYSELAAMFANSGKGHHVIITKMPANLAVMDSKAAVKIIEEFPGKSWVIGGHSLGGAMACSMLKKESESFVGLILMAAYPAESIDLSQWKGAVLSITASNDEVLDWEKFEVAKANLPVQVQFHEIGGGNHGGFGSYGEQDGDGEAEISRAAQHLLIIEQIQKFYLENEFE